MGDGLTIPLFSYLFSVIVSLLFHTTNQVYSYLCNAIPDDTTEQGPRATAFESFARAVYVEVNDVNPLNAGEYLLPGGKPFFTHVILFASNIRDDANKNVHNYNNPNNAAILQNPAKYIKPL